MVDLRHIWRSESPLNLHSVVRLNLVMAFETLVLTLLAAEEDDHFPTLTVEETLRQVT